jgi:hypothetical protein
LHPRRIREYDPSGSDDNGFPRAVENDLQNLIGKDATQFNELIPLGRQRQCGRNRAIRPYLASDQSSFAHRRC